MPWPVAVAIAGVLVVLEVTAIAIVTTHDRGNAPPATPQILDASLTNPKSGSSLRVAAQAADGTIVRVESRWPDGHVDATSGGCGARSFGGEIDREVIDHPHRASRVEVRALSRRCVMPGKELRASRWRTVFLAANRQ